MPLAGTDFSARSRERFSHVYISLYLKQEDDLKPVQALDWNEAGFNFFLDEKIAQKEIVFKKELKTFTGKVVWNIKNDDDNTLLEMIINNKILSRLEQYEGDRENLLRIFKMVRSVGLLEKKQDVLSVLGVKLTINELDQEMNLYQERNPLYRYGVEVVSEDWKDICAETLRNAPPEDTYRPLDELIHEISGSKK